MNSRPFKKVAVAGAAVLAGTAGVIGLTASAAAADTASDLLAHTNDVRTASGLAPLAPDSHLSDVASGWANAMASSSTLTHNPSLAGQVGGARKIGENVGQGSDVASVESGFEASPEHRANILDPDFTTVGFGVAQSGDGVSWVTADFN